MMKCRSDSLKGFLPFHQTIEVPGIEKNSRYEIKSGLEQLTTILIDNTQVEIKAVINLNLIAFSIGNQKTGTGSKLSGSGL